MSHYKGREGLKQTKKKLLGVTDAMDCYDGFTCVNICVIYRMSIIPQWTCSCDRWAAAHLNAESFPQGRERGKRVQLRIREQWPGLGGCGDHIPSSHRISLRRAELGQGPCRPGLQTDLRKPHRFTLHQKAFLPDWKSLLSRLISSLIFIEDFFFVSLWREGPTIWCSSSLTPSSLCLFSTLNFFFLFFPIQYPM